MPSVLKVVGSTPPLAATQGPWASPSPVIACMTDVAPCGYHAAKFDSCNSLLSSVHTLLVNILRCDVSYCILNENIIIIIIIMRGAGRNEFAPLMIPVRLTSLSLTRRRRLLN